MSQPRRVSILGIVATVAFIAAACAPVGPSGTQPSRDEIVVLQSADPATLDPAQSLLVHVFNVVQNVLDTPTYLDRELKVQPRLATSWKPLDDRTWEIKLRTGVKFQDGQAFNAEALKASFVYQTDKDTAARTFFDNWESMEVVDAQTIRVRTKQPDPFVPNVLTRLWLFSPAELKDPKAFGTKISGTGAYRLVEFVKGDRVVLERNPEYWGPAPKVKRVTFRSAPEASARVAALLSGQADIVVNLPVEQAKELASNKNVRVASITGLRAVTIQIDTREGKPLSDVRVRQAMNHAIDKDSIIKNILGGFATQQAATISSLIDGHNPDVKPYAFDPEKAKALLKEAGYPNGFTMEFHHSTGRWVKDAEVAQAIASMLANVGIKVTLTTVEYSTYFGTWSKGQYKGMSMIGVTNPDGAPNSLFNLFLWSKGPWPWSWTDDKMDQLIVAARGELNRDKRISLYRQLDQHVHDNAPWIFLYEQKDLYGVNGALKWQPTPHEFIYLWDASY